MKKTELIARGVITEKDRILVCRDKKNENYFLPGGHIEFGEFSSKALFRELKEELALEAKDLYFIGVAENMYKVRGESHHEVNFVYEVRHDGLNFQSKEEHIEFSFFSFKEFEDKDVRPLALKKAIVNWQKSRKFFHLRTIDKCISK